MSKYKQELPADVESQLDAYIERIKAIQWFKPSSDLKREAIDTTINLALKAFGVEASIEYRRLSIPNDWDAARGAAWGAARDAARGACDLLALNLDSYKEKYPTGNFIHLIPLWEAGLYPYGVVDGKFVVYVPPAVTEFPSDLV